ncbi:MAG TPA: ATP-dependent Clp protease ATP-binding subunit ClpX, partial [Sphaerochaeta sp.]|nr:ATP-dependent Clp protease ATP-binding subunit ClpX [Sphaerochaeta sp.]
LFICGGAFVGLDKVIEKRVSSHAMGFGATIVNTQEKDLHALYSKMMPDDLIKFGLIPEFIGRLPIHVALDNLSKKDLMRIIVEPKNSILRQYEAAFRLDGIEFIFKNEAVEAVAEKAFEQKTGARGLRSIVENIMMGIMYDIPSIHQVKQVIVGRECVLEGKQPEVIRGA